MESYITDLQEACAIYESINPVDECQLMFEDVSQVNAENKKKTEDVFAKLKAAVGKVITFIKNICIKIGTTIKNLFVSKENQEIQREYLEMCKEFPELKNVKFEVEDYKKYVKDVKLQQAKLQQAINKKDESAITEEKSKLEQALDAAMGKVGVTAENVTRYFNDGCRMIGTVKNAADDLLDQTAQFASNLDKNKDFNGASEAIKATGYNTMTTTLMGKAFAKYLNKGDGWFKRNTREVYRNLKDVSVFLKSHGKDPYAKAALHAMMLKSPIGRTGAAVGHAYIGAKLSLWGHGIEGSKEMMKASTYTNKATRNAQVSSLELFAAGGRTASQTVNNTKYTVDAVRNFIKSDKKVMNPDDKS